MNDNNILYCKSVEGLTRPARRFAMTFYDEMRALVLRHGAINNPYLDRFKTGALTDEESRLLPSRSAISSGSSLKFLSASLLNLMTWSWSDDLSPYCP